MAAPSTLDPWKEKGIPLDKQLWGGKTSVVLRRTFVHLV